MKKQFGLFLFISIIFTISCDFDRYIGYDLDAQELLETTMITGRITNLYDDRPVYSAKIKLGLLETLTDINGNYRINYVYSSDEARNKPIQVSVEAHNYFFEHDTILVEPISNEFNFQLRYAAPLILRVARRISILEVGREWTKYGIICQTIVRDYQGIDNISEVYARFYYNEADDTLKVPLLVKSIPSTITFHFQGVYEGMIAFDLNYDICVCDFDGFSNKLELANNPFQQDTLLFDPDFKFNKYLP